MGIWLLQWPEVLRLRGANSQRRHAISYMGRCKIAVIIKLNGCARNMYLFFILLTINGIIESFRKLRRRDVMGKTNFMAYV